MARTRHHIRRLGSVLVSELRAADRLGDDGRRGELVVVVDLDRVARGACYVVQSKVMDRPGESCASLAGLTRLGAVSPAGGGGVSMSIAGPR